MHRNLDRRVEALVRVRDRSQRDDLIGLFDRAMDDRTASWRLDGDGTWTRRTTDGEEPLSDIQDYLMGTRR
jgi:polyphosphate kinase